MAIQAESSIVVVLSGMMSKIFLRGQEARNEDLQKRKGEENAAFSGKFRPGYVVHIGPGEEETRLSQVAHPPKETWNASTQKFLKVFKRHGSLVIQGSQILREGILRSQSTKVHFAACTTSKSMLEQPDGLSNFVREREYSLSRSCRTFGKCSCFCSFCRERLRAMRYS